MVAAAWRRFAQAARWKGQAPHVAMGNASIRLSHCQWSNCRGVNIPRAITGTASTPTIATRWASGSRSPVAPAEPGTAGAPDGAPGGAGTQAS